ncbi:hypothetical protein [Luteolibacter soli]|uniref:Uncharacterized protein n=1 Tax=Luteolibacter soli TaxID=3135280 RepID=A0ABU9ATN4_9BACT
MLALTGIACASGLASCGMPNGGMERVSVPVARQAAKPGMAVKAYFFTAPDSFAFVKGQQQPGVAGTYDAEAGEALVASLSRRKGFELLQGKPQVSSAKLGEKRELKVTREFVYPTEYKPPVVGKVVDGQIQSVTPATPTSFEKKNLGVELGYRATRSAGGKIQVELDLKRGSFLGFVNYGTPIKTKGKGIFGRDVDVVLTENRIEMPVFDVKKMSSSVLVNDGDFIAMGGMMPDEAVKDARFSSWKGGSAESVGKNFVALIQVKAEASE